MYDRRFRTEHDFHARQGSKVRCDPRDIVIFGNTSYLWRSSTWSLLLQCQSFPFARSSSIRSGNCIACSLSSVRLHRIFFFTDFSNCKYLVLVARASKRSWIYRGSFQATCNFSLCIIAIRVGGPNCSQSSCSR